MLLEAQILYPSISCLKSVGEGSIDGADESTFDSVGVMEGSIDDFLD